MADYRIKSSDIKDLDGYSLELTLAKVQNVLENGLDHKQEKAAFLSLVNQGESRADFDELLEAASKLQLHYQKPVLVHLRAGDVARDALDSFVKRARQLGLVNFLVISGDKQRLANGFSTAVELMAALREEAGDDLVLASTIDVNPGASKTVLTSIEKLNEKAQAGADWFITQIFFDDELLMEIEKESAGRFVLVPGVVDSLSDKTMNWIEKRLAINVPEECKVDQKVFLDQQVKVLEEKGFTFFHHFGMN
ncbi:methylenetetrahydrofolate reductase [Fructobacillus sp. W13]|uniref:Methylenetetrahydrofolate reductase n=1 Tax=Fructobacillus apis TaxID=2935017 RepID=A0ABT0ZPS1_9LACO|nr:methylenetetrahydrofolate reductase [Fructobacillus apis]MCO0831987.1 methylenetetrahydrofolate reductase [Fructobacillus apis]